MRDFFQVRGWRRFFLLFSVVVLSVLFFTNCDHGLEPPKPIGMGVVAEMDPVTYVSMEPILKPRYSCGGNLLEHPKYLGSESKEVVVPGRKKLIHDSVLNQAGYFFIGTSAGSKVSSFVPLNPNLDRENLVSENKKSSGSGFGHLWDIGKPILAFLLGLIGFVLALIITAWIIKKLIELASRLFEKSSSVSSSPVQEKQLIGLSDLSEEDQKNLITEVKAEVMKELESDSDFVSLDDRLYYKHVEEMTKILQQTGGKVDCVIGNCTYMIEIHEQKNKEKS